MLVAPYSATGMRAIMRRACSLEAISNKKYLAIRRDYRCPVTIWDRYLRINIVRNILSALSINDGLPLFSENRPAVGILTHLSPIRRPFQPKCRMFDNVRHLFPDKATDKYLPAASNEDKIVLSNRDNFALPLNNPVVGSFNVN